MNKKHIEISVDSAWCKGCGICVSFCPTGTLAQDDASRTVVAAPEACTGCELCERLCPDLAIGLEKAL